MIAKLSNSYLINLRIQIELFTKFIKENIRQIEELKAWGEREDHVEIVIDKWLINYYKKIIKDCQLRLEVLAEKSRQK